MGFDMNKHIDSFGERLEDYLMMFVKWHEFRKIFDVPEIDSPRFFDHHLDEVNRVLAIERIINLHEVKTKGLYEVRLSSNDFLKTPYIDLRFKDYSDCDEYTERPDSQEFTFESDGVEFVTSHLKAPEDIIVAKYIPIQVTRLLKDAYRKREIVWHKP